MNLKNQYKIVVHNIIILMNNILNSFKLFRTRTLQPVLKMYFFLFLDCGSNVSSSDYGIITSPNFPLNYEGPSRGMASKTCNWYVNVRPNHKILLNFELFAVEGEPTGKNRKISKLIYNNNEQKSLLKLCHSNED